MPNYRSSPRLRAAYDKLAASAEVARRLRLIDMGGYQGVSQANRAGYRLRENACVRELAWGVHRLMCGGDGE